MQVEARPATHCPVCKRPVDGHHATVNVHGLTFHAYCAGYKRRLVA